MCSDRIYSFPHFFFHLTGLSELGMPVVASPDFGRSVNLISRGAPNYYLAPHPPPGFWDLPTALLEGRWDGGLTIGSPSPSLISILRPTQRCTVIELFFFYCCYFLNWKSKHWMAKLDIFKKWRSRIFLSDPKSYFWLTGLLQHWCPL